MTRRSLIYFTLSTVIGMVVTEAGVTQDYACNPETCRHLPSILSNNADVVQYICYKSCILKHSF